MLHNTLHEVTRNKSSVVMFKLDLRKAYDKINWNCMFDICRTKGFPEMCICWIQQIACGGSVACMLNGPIGSYIKTKKGLMQGIPFF
jgi:hypothetical protein